MRSIETEHLCFRTVSLLVVAEDMSLHSKSLTLPSPTDELKILENIIEQLLGVYLKESILNLRRIGVRLSSFAPLSGQTNFQAYLG